MVSTPPRPRRCSKPLIVIPKSTDLVYGTLMLPVQINFERAFKVVNYIDPKPNELLEFIKLVRPGIPIDIFPDSILDKGPEGAVLYIGPSGMDVVRVQCSPEKHRVFIIPFVGGSLIKNPDGIEEYKELTLLAICPFKIDLELSPYPTPSIDNELQERLEALLAACRVELTPILSTLSEHHRVVQKALEWGLTWVYDGDPTKGLLDTIPNEPGTYLCGNGPSGLLYKLPGDRFCITLDTRKCKLIQVES